MLGTNFRIPSPTYEAVIRDAILRNESLGNAHNLEVFAGKVYPIDRSQPVELGAFFLSSQPTTAWPTP